MSSLMVRLSFLAMDCARFSMSGGRVTESVLVFLMLNIVWQDLAVFSVIQVDRLGCHCPCAQASKNVNHGAADAGWCEGGPAPEFNVGCQFSRERFVDLLRKRVETLVVFFARVG